MTSVLVGIGTPSTQNRDEGADCKNSSTSVIDSSAAYPVVVRKMDNGLKINSDIFKGKALGEKHKHNLSTIHCTNFCSFCQELSLAWTIFSS